MFVSHDKNVNKKKIQKPNILRKKSKIPSVKLTITTGSCESAQVKSPAPMTTSESDIADVREEQISDYESCKSMQNVKNFTQTQKTNLDDVTSYELQVKATESNNIEVNENNTLQTIESAALLAGDGENEDQSALDVESLLDSSPLEEETITLYGSDMCQTKLVDLQGNQKWCFEFTNNTPKIVLKECESSQSDRVPVEQKPNIISAVIPLAVVSSAPRQSTKSLPAGPIVGDRAIKKFSMEQLLTKSNKYTCDEPDCNKHFMSEQRLIKHRSVHNKNDGSGVPKPTTSECPVKKITKDGITHPCGMVFQMKVDLIKHLNEDHKPEDAIYRCEECGRSFFWASGLRAHGRTHRSRRPRTSLACPWPGCGRVFRQPCRLREHARSHTGDKPYPCHYPNCDWSFRTASKLVRHIRRHTGDRRFPCAVCGRAFTRREHLRDHVRRHTRRVCPNPGCGQIFNNGVSLYKHINKAHKKEAEKDWEKKEEGFVFATSLPIKNTVTLGSKSPETETDTTNNVEEDPDDSALLSLSVFGAEVGCMVCEDEMELEAAEGEDVGVEGAVLRFEEHAARTHCTWPLSPLAHPFEQPDDYVLDEDGQVEHSEISENYIYTVRSDLFLHGNVLTNDDSQQMSGCGEVGTLDAELLLAPSVDIAQEELYTDAVDESAFRVFLLSGEDLA